MSNEKKGTSIYLDGKEVAFWCEDCTPENCSGCPPRAEMIEENGIELEGKWITWEEYHSVSDSEDWDDYWDDDDECGMLNDGYCLYAGSEFCDWHCPLDD